MLMITQTKQLCIFLIFIYFLDNNTVKQVLILLSISSWVKIKIKDDTINFFKLD
ncbi:hypothetical protein Lgor_2959 [Fluoribacter gormanii]|uniref:Uncharacterized protein n=1 Tax=Fluoribacter gormanii TaxID=464 RepID=A0A377GFA9_9GAMM|nr:hypothetical protein Lgor_2959 [Fluoribacter gormanii]SIR09389.1 hypothetical protein SAMN05421777_106100 [Fluoribacter gormanii]STO23215.1 Uncharacterised protein [Fluoribacter gormanii]